jgi:hypothetical protein
MSLARYLRSRWRSLTVVAMLGAALASLVTGGLPSNQPAAAGQKFEAIMHKAPHAYTGECAVQKFGDRWYEGGSHDITRFQAPIPCANLWGSVEATPTGSGLAVDIQTSTAPSEDKVTYATSDKLWIKVSQRRSDGSYVIRWGAAPGVQVEWLFVFVNQPGMAFTHGDPSHYPQGLVWRPFNGVTEPDFSVYANDIRAPTGSLVSISGTNLVPIP